MGLTSTRLEWQDLIVAPIALLSSSILHLHCFVGTTHFFPSATPQQFGRSPLSISPASPQWHRVYPSSQEEPVTQSLPCSFLPNCTSA